jgi:hypothetical protein
VPELDCAGERGAGTEATSLNPAGIERGRSAAAFDDCGGPRQRRWAVAAPAEKREAPRRSGWR